MDTPLAIRCTGLVKTYPSRPPVEVTVAVYLGSIFDRSRSCAVISTDMVTTKDE